MTALDLLSTGLMFYAPPRRDFELCDLFGAIGRFLGEAQRRNWRRA